MRCPNCGRDVPVGRSICPTCHAPVPSPALPSTSMTDSGGDAATVLFSVTPGETPTAPGTVPADRTGVTATGPGLVHGHSVTATGPVFVPGHASSETPTGPGRHH